MSNAPVISQGGALVDASSPLHALVGFTAGVLGVEPHLAMMVFIGARIVEQSLRAGAKHALFGREQGQSLGNELTDLMLELGGLQLGEKLREHLQPEPAAGLGAPRIPRVMTHNGLQVTLQ